MMRQVKLQDSFLDERRELSLYDVVFPLLSMTESGVPEFLLGSCFPLGRGLYATAAHVFEPFMIARRRYTRLQSCDTPLTDDEKSERARDIATARPFDDIDVNCGALILDQAAIRNGEFRLVGFSLVKHIEMFLDDDLALLFLHDDKRRNKHGDIAPIGCLPITESPSVGEKVTVTGFPARNHRIKIEQKDRLVDFSAWLGLVESSGEICKLNTVKRDNAVCFFPCIETTARMAAGHSGGPAISIDTGGVIGVNSTGLESTAYSVVSWIGKALDHEFTLPFAVQAGDCDIAPGRVVSLRLLAKRGLLQINSRSENDR